VQEMLGIGHTKAYELLTKPGGIPNIRIGRAIRINRQELDDWLERQKHQDVND
jgi:excisionase family DNA binding protein